MQTKAAISAAVALLIGGCAVENNTTFSLLKENKLAVVKVAPLSLLDVFNLFPPGDINFKAVDSVTLPRSSRLIEIHEGKHVLTITCDRHPGQISSLQELDLDVEVESGRIYQVRSSNGCNVFFEEIKG